MEISPKEMEVFEIVDELKSVADYLSRITLEFEESTDQEEYESCKDAEWLLWRNISRLKRYANCPKVKNRAGFIVA